MYEKTTSDKAEVYQQGVCDGLAATSIAMAIDQVVRDESGDDLDNYPETETYVYDKAEYTATMICDMIDFADELVDIIDGEVSMCMSSSESFVEIDDMDDFYYNEA